MNAPLSHDFIEIRELLVASRIGVPDEERARAQTLTLNLRLYPFSSLSGLKDQIESTVDYAVLSEGLINLANQGERKLIETLAEDLADFTLANFPVREVRVEVAKHILPWMKSVSVVLTKINQS